MLCCVEFCCNAAFYSLHSVWFMARGLLRSCATPARRVPMKSCSFYLLCLVTWQKVASRVSGCRLSGCSCACVLVCLPAYLPPYLPACLTICLSVCLSICLSACLAFCLSCRSVCQSVLSVCLTVSRPVRLTACEPKTHYYDP